MGNKQTHTNHHSYPERSLSWQPDPSNGMPPRRNSFTNQNQISNGHGPRGPTPMMPRGYAASEIGAPRYQKRSPIDNRSNLGNKFNPASKAMIQQQRPYQQQPPPFIRPGLEFMPPNYPPPPVPMYGTMPRGPPPGAMPPFIYPPPPFGPPMDPLYVSSRASSSSDSKRIKKLRQKQQKMSRHESNLSTVSEMPPHPMYAIMPPPLPAGMYGPAVYRTRSMDNVYVRQNKLMIENGSGGKSKQRVDSPHGSEKVHKGKSKSAKINENQQSQEINVQTLQPMKDHLSPIIDSGNTKAVTKTNAPRFTNGQFAETDSINDNVMDAKPTPQNGKNARKISQESPTAVNIHFEYSEKEKSDKFRPAVTMVRSDAQAIMERNAKRLADAEWEEDQKPGVVVVNEDERQTYDVENDENEKKSIYGCLPSRKVDDEVYQQRSLQRPVNTLKKEKELLELKPIPILKPTVPKITEPSPIISSSSTGEVSSQTSSRRSSGSKRSVKMAKNYDERGELMIEAILNPVLYQQKSKMREEFKPMNAWNEINVSSELSKRRPTSARSNGHSQRAVDEKIMVRLIHSPPPKHTNNQEPIYLDYEKRLPDFKKRLIETGSFGFSELDKFQQQSSRNNSQIGATLKHDPSNSSKMMKKSDDWTNQEVFNEKEISNDNTLKKQRYSFDNRSKSNMELKSLTPSIAKIKAGDCSDIDFSWVDDLESRFRLEREQFERELQCIKERTLQRGIKSLQPADKYASENQPKDQLYQPKDQPYSTQQSSSMGETSTLLDSISHRTNSIEETGAANPARMKFESNVQPSRYIADYDSKMVNHQSGSNYLRDYPVPNNDNRISSVKDDIQRPDIISNNYNNTRSRMANFEQENRRNQQMNGHHFESPQRHFESSQRHFESSQRHFELPQRYQNSRNPIEDEPIYIPKPDYEHMENENNIRPLDSKMQHVYQSNDRMPNYPERNQDQQQYNPYFDRSLTIQTAQNHENSNRQPYAVPSPRSPSQRKLNRYYNPNAPNGTSNVYNSDSEWIEAESENGNRERYNLQLSGSYSINPNISDEFKSFDSVDKTFVEPPSQNGIRQYNGGKMQYNRNQQDISDDNNTRRFVEKMNEFSSEDSPKWSRNPTRNYPLTNGHGNGNEPYNSIYISRPGSGNMKNNLLHRSNGNHVYGSSQY